METTPKTKLFFLEDDLSFGAVLKSYLELNDFDVFWCTDGRQALADFEKEPFDLCLLDVMLPNLDGFSVAKAIRQKQPNLPFVFLTAKNMKEDILTGYKTGADDYITKPFDTEVLLFKIKAILNRKGSSGSKQTDTYSIGRYRFNARQRLLTIENQEQSLSPKEAELLELLVLNKNRLLARDLALEKIWGQGGYFTARSMDVYLTKLRKYLAADTCIEIKTVHGTGFILSVEEEVTD